jgi:hypothetical protein
LCLLGWKDFFEKVHSNPNMPASVTTMFPATKLIARVTSSRPARNNLAEREIGVWTSRESFIMISQIVGATALAAWTPRLAKEECQNVLYRGALLHGP